MKKTVLALAATAIAALATTPAFAWCEDGGYGSSASPLPYRVTTHPYNPVSSWPYHVSYGHHGSYDYGHPDGYVSPGHWQSAY